MESDKIRAGSRNSSDAGSYYNTGGKRLSGTDIYFEDIIEDEGPAIRHAPIFPSDNITASEVVSKILKFESLNWDFADDGKDIINAYRAQAAKTNHHIFIPPASQLLYPCIKSSLPLLKPMTEGVYQATVKVALKPEKYNLYYFNEYEEKHKEQSDKEMSKIVDSALDSLGKGTTVKDFAGMCCVCV